MKHSLWTKNLLYLACLLLLVFSASSVMKDLEDIWERSWEISTYTIFAAKCIPFFLAGLLLGIDSLLKEWKSPGRWKVDWKKLVLLCVPTLYLGLSSFVYFSSFLCNFPVLQYPAGVLLKGETGFLGIFQMAFGYFILTSFTKIDKQAEAADGTGDQQE